MLLSSHARFTLVLLATMSTPWLAGPSFANAELAKKYACLACHTVEKKVVGPSYKDVAKKYAGQKDAVNTLATSIRKGGSGKWGNMVMPPQTSLSEADAKVLAKWVLDGAK